jgi:hypothetical protein
MKDLTIPGLLGRLCVACTAGAAIFGALGPSTAGAASSPSAAFNRPGDILIADQFNNRVVEINPQNHQVVWQFGNGSSTPGPRSVVGTNDAERVGTLTLISGTGTPAGADPSCTAMNGCPDNRSSW